MKWAVTIAYLVGCIFAPALLLSEDQFFNHSYGVVIGIDRYPHRQLNNAVNDARAIADYLRAQKYDQVITLYDQQATKQAIVAAMQNQLAPKLKKGDRALVFFAGHGFTETLGGKDRGYFVPYDGGGESASFISMDELMSFADYMGNARHLLFIMDSCYGGMLGAETRGSLVDPHIPDYLSNVAERVTREVLTAGGKDQEVDDGSNGHSVFVDAILEALVDGKADKYRNGYITFNELFDYVMQRASNRYETPLASVLPGNQGGEYLFRSPLARASAAASQTEVARGKLRSAEPGTTRQQIHPAPDTTNTLEVFVRPQQMRLCISVGCNNLTWVGDHYDGTVDGKTAVVARYWVMEWTTNEVELIGKVVDPDPHGNRAEGVFKARISPDGTSIVDGRDEWHAGPSQGTMGFTMTWSKKQDSR